MPFLDRLPIINRISENSRINQLLRISRSLNHLFFFWLIKTACGQKVKSVKENDNCKSSRVNADIYDIYEVKSKNLYLYTIVSKSS